MRHILNRLAFTIVMGVALSLGDIGSALAQAPQRSEGEDLYRRGFYAEAITWWTAAAANGDIEAARRLGVEYMDGKKGVVERDYEKAYRYHLQAAKGGERLSMFDLGTMHEQGLGVEASLVEAARWYEWSAKYGYVWGQYNIATMLENGEAGRKDEVEAYMYYLLAAAQGQVGLGYDAKTNRALTAEETPMGLLAKRLTPAQRADAEGRVKAFKPMSGPLPH